MPVNWDFLSSYASLCAAGLAGIERVRITLENRGFWKPSEPVLTALSRDFWFPVRAGSVLILLPLQVGFPINLGWAHILKHCDLWFNLVDRLKSLAGWWAEVTGLSF